MADSTDYDALAASYPIGTTNPDALAANLQDIDYFVHSDDLTTVSRLGKTLKTWQGVVADTQMTPLNGDGTWAADIDFNAFNEYMVYDGTAYKLKYGTTLPYTSTATPDTDYVEPFADVTSNNIGEYINTGQEQTTGLSIYPSNSENIASIDGDYTTAPSGTTALRGSAGVWILNGIVTTAGLITAFDETNRTANIGGTDYTLTPQAHIRKETMSAFVADTNIPVYSIVDILSQSTGFDTATLPLGGGQFLVVPASTATADNIVYFDLDSGLQAMQIGKNGNLTTLDYDCSIDGTSDATDALQLLFTRAGKSLYYSHPWSGSGRLIADPIIRVEAGRYKLTDTLTMYEGSALKGPSHPANTVSHTRLIMDSTATVVGGGTGDNRNKSIISFNRGTVNNAAVANTNLTVSIEDMEFWYVTLGNNFDAPLGGSGIPFGDYPDSGSLLFDVPTVDSRILNSVFQHAPSAIRIKDVPASLTSSDTMPDGWPGNGNGVHLFIEGCEFDASSSSHIYATNSDIYLHFKNCHFYGGMHYYGGCSGKVIYENCTWEDGAWIDAKTETNNFEILHIKGGTVENPSSTKFCQVEYTTPGNANTFHLNGVTFTRASATGLIEVNYASAGGIEGNVVVDSGYNATEETDPADTVAVIDLIGCVGLGVHGNSLCTPDSASYNGFGIRTKDGDSRDSSDNDISGNSVPGDYNGAAYRGQNRRINIADGDYKSNNFVGGTGDKYFYDQYKAALNVLGYPIVSAETKTATYAYDVSGLSDTNAVVEIVATSSVDSSTAPNVLKATAFFNGSGLTLVQDALSNPQSEGVISVSGTVITFTYSSADFIVNIACNRMFGIN